MDQELIRKAAEAIYASGVKCRNQWRAGASIPLHAVHKWEELHSDTQDEFSEQARAALKVFYEHTRSQAREQAPPKCPDCSAEMKPTGTALVFFTCPQCGATRQ